MIPTQHWSAWLSLCIVIIHCVPSAESLTLKMVRRDAIDRTLFPKNLSDIEKTRIFTDLAHSRVNTHGLGPDAVRPRVMQFGNSVFAAAFQVGSQGIGGYLAIDTGSQWLWIQCEGCTGCPDLRVPRYNPAASNTWTPIPFTSHDCTTGERFKNEDQCAFVVNYVTGSTNGKLGFETFFFNSAEPPGIVDLRLTFGCALEMSPDLPLGRADGENNVLMGILGLMFRESSFMMETRFTTHFKFSYCLPSWRKLEAGVETALTFGDNVPAIPPMARTIFMDGLNYNLYCIDISVAGNRLNLDPNIFRVGPNGQGGFIIDTGSGFTLLKHEAFERVKNAVSHMIAHRHGLHPLPFEQLPNPNFKLCYGGGFPAGLWLPSMTFHFENNVEIVIASGNVFFDIPGLIACLAIMDGGQNPNVPNLFGAFQQADHRFWHDLHADTLSFTSQECPE